VGSADHTFYGLESDGSLRWKLETGEIIDSAAVLLRAGISGPGETLIVPSGDGYLYNVLAADGSVLWKFDARVSPRASYNNWWEGNVAVGVDGGLYAGNTNFNYYAIDPTGVLRWTYPTESNAWSLAAFDDVGRVFWGSVDTFVHAVDTSGAGLWKKRTLGFVSASAAVGSDGTVYIGSFDSNLYALDPTDGKAKWSYKTADHIYSSVALGETGGRTSVVYLTSTDGRAIALDTAGRVLWEYDTGDPIRSSPVLGREPGSEGMVLYFGSGNGKLYALDARTGQRRWSFDTTPSDDELRDRNDLNGSPALGAKGIYIGGEHGNLWYVPYDYCLRAVEDARCAAGGAGELPDRASGFFWVTPGGSTILDKREPLIDVPVSSLLTLRLLEREGGKTLDVGVCNRPVGCSDSGLIVHADPPFPFRVEKSADGHYLHLIPEGFLLPDTEYRISVSADIHNPGASVGNLTLGGSRRRRVEDTLTFRTTAPASGAFPLTIRPNSADAIEWTRLAAPMPPMLPSLNQIGFDYLDWIIAPVHAAEDGRLVLWAVGAKRDAADVLRADPESPFALPLSGRTAGSAFSVANRDFTMPITGIPIPFNLLELRGDLTPAGRVRPGATAFADADVLSIPTFGPYLALGGLANDWFKKLVVAGTYTTRRYDGPANHRPPGLSISEIELLAPTNDRAGRVTARFANAEGAAYISEEHRPAIVLIDRASHEAVSLDYAANLAPTTDAAGNLTGVSLNIPPGTELPTQLDAVLVFDAFPLESRRLR
jgi:outer membrane protein assembly factor BamB